MKRIGYFISILILVCCNVTYAYDLPVNWTIENHGATTVKVKEARTPKLLSLLAPNKNFNMTNKFVATWIIPTHHHDDIYIPEAQCLVVIDFDAVYWLGVGSVIRGTPSLFVSPSPQSRCNAYVNGKDGDSELNIRVAVF